MRDRRKDRQTTWRRRAGSMAMITVFNEGTIVEDKTANDGAKASQKG